MLTIAAYGIRAILEGGLSLLPGGVRLFHKGTRGSDSARYCYSVWLRHLVKTQPFNDMGGSCPGTVVELGPGDSLGTGLAALLCGAERYVAVDAVEHACAERNLRILEALTELFSIGASIPDQQEFPEVKPLLDDYAFPAFVPRTLEPERCRAIEAAFRGRLDEKSLVTYVRPNEARQALSPGSVDLIFSQAVLEHVDDLRTLYRNCSAWLRPGGLMSHQIDFKSHGTSHEWNGHWVYPDAVWRLIRGNRPYLLNREPCSTHLRLLTENGFQIVLEERSRVPSRLHRGQLATRFREMSDQDLITAGVYVVGRKVKPETRFVERSQRGSSCVG
ncbi:MAG: methyltransferase domain-containing protein [Desulfobacterota bacterium]|jgi:SAM-dependent methyltransferase|nr:methyltransferase domain-containing protein [Thermodesulfobacteriota bacterium]